MTVSVDYTQLGVRPFHLQLERESADFWIVTDAHQPDAPMIRTPSWDTAVRFMETFLERTPGASMEQLHSWRVAQDTLSERGATESGHEGAPTSAHPYPGSGQASVAAPANLPPRSENVYPLFHDQLDESA